MKYQIYTRDRVDVIFKRLDVIQLLSNIVNNAKNFNGNNDMKYINKYNTLFI